MSTPVLPTNPIPQGNAAVTVQGATVSATSPAGSAIPAVSVNPHPGFVRDSPSGDLVAVGGVGSGFYQTILDDDGDALPQETALQIVGGTLSDVLGIATKLRLWYQTVAFGGEAMTQEPVIDFNASEFSLTDTPGVKTTVRISRPLPNVAAPTDVGSVLLVDAGAVWVAGAVNPTTLKSFSASTATNQFLKGNGPGVAASWGTLTAQPANPGDNNKAAIAVNGDFSYAFIADANIASNAAISTSKIAPAGLNGQALITSAGVPGWGTDFGSQSLTTTGAVNTATLVATSTITAASIALGTNPSTTGVLRLQNVGLITSRNGANSADITLMQLGNTNVLTLGLNTGVAGLTAACAAGGNITLIIGAVNAMTLSSSSLQWGISTMAFPANAVASLSIAGNTAAPGSQLSITGGNTSQISAVGGLLLLAGGASTNATPGFPGGIKLRPDNVEVAGTMIEVYKVAAAQHYVALFGRTTTTSQMGAGTGDYTLYVADAAVVPTVDATNGFVHYSDGAKPGWRFNGTSFRLNGTSASANVGGVVPPATVSGYLDVQVNGTQQKIPYYAA